MPVSDIKKRIEVNRVDWVVEIYGEGVPVVMMHGFPDSPATFQSLITDVVNAGYQVVLPFLPGYGPSNVKGSSTYHPYNFSKDFDYLLNQLGYPNDVFIGNDWGA